MKFKINIWSVRLFVPLANTKYMTKIVNILCLDMEQLAMSIGNETICFVSVHAFLKNL